MCSFAKCEPYFANESLDLHSYSDEIKPLKLCSKMYSFAPSMSKYPHLVSKIPLRSHEEVAGIMEVPSAQTEKVGRDHRSLEE